MNWLQKRREQRERNQDVSRLWGMVHDLDAQLRDARLERDWWQRLAVDAQFEIEELKDIVANLKARL